MKKRLLSALLVLALVCALLPQFTLPAKAAVSGDCGMNLTWSFDEVTGILTISGSGRMDGWATADSVPWYDFRSDIKALSLTDQLESIGVCAFCGCTGLTSVVIPASVKIIDGVAFGSCTNLASVTIPESVTRIEAYVFQHCTSLKTITIPDGVTEICSLAFQDCSSMESVTIPESVIQVYTDAFFGCSKLASVTILNRDCTIGGDPLYDQTNTLGVPDSTTIFGHKYSTAQQFAENHGYKFQSIDCPNGHSFLEWEQTYAPTCTEAGQEYRVCSECGEIEFREAAPLGHDFKNGVCTRCGEREAVTVIHFTDVKDDAYYADPVAWAVERGVTKGTSDTKFSPESICTRGQVVTFLWRAAGSPEPDSIKTPFTDVQSGAYYEKAVAWAVENNITSGTSKTAFSPENSCTRGQIVTFLWRFEGKPEVSTSGSRFRDVAPGAYYEKAVAWAVESGVTNGTSKSAFSPEAKCTRAQVVTFLYRSQGHPLEPVEFKGMVGISMPTKDLWRWNRDGAAMQKLLEAAGYDVDLQFAANNPSMQISQIENMIAYGAQVLIITAIDGYALDVVLEQAKEAACTVIAYDRPIGSDAVNYYVTFDNYSVGAAQGKYIADKLDLANAGGKVYNIEFACGSPDDGNAYVFYEGAMSELRKYINAGTLNVVSGQYAHFEDVATQWWASEVAQARFENILSAYYTNRPLHAVMCSNDSTAQGVIAALNTSYHNAVYPIITGQDCDIVSVRHIMDGKQSMSVFKNTSDLAAKAVEMADAILKGSVPDTNAQFTSSYGDYTYPAFFCGPTICTKDNLQALLIDTGYYTWADLQH